MAKTAPSRKTRRVTDSDAAQKRADRQFLLQITRRMRALLARRPHRSFRLTRRRDYVRPLQLPGYWAFTGNVARLLWRYKRLFSGVVIVYGLLMIVFGGIGSQDDYSQLSATLKDGNESFLSGQLGAVAQAGLLLISSASGSINGNITPAQQLYATIIGLLTWLTVVWLLRVILAGQRPRLRDGLYNAGAPILATVLVAMLLVVQLLPIALAALGYSAALASGLLAGGAEAMLFWIVAGLLVLLSVYWLTSTFFALIVVTLPGMYPMQAIKAAGDLVIGRRLRILLRMLWLGLIVILVWSVVMLPVILFDSWIKTVWQAVSWFPLVPLALVVMGVFTLLWSAGYVYLLYRRIVEDESAPA